MIDVQIQNALLQELCVLPLEKQQQVLDFARGLTSQKQVGRPGRELMSLAGIMSDEDAEQMLAAIEEGCERIDPNEW